VWGCERWATEVIHTHIHIHIRPYSQTAQSWKKGGGVSELKGETRPLNSPFTLLYSPCNVAFPLVLSILPK
jgi:hypothetical protein